MSQTLHARWMQWTDLTWTSNGADWLAIVQLCDRMLQSALDARLRDEFVQKELPEIATEFSVQWAAVVERTPDWKTRIEFGRQGAGVLPYQFFEEALDRSACGSVRPENAAGWSFIAIPLPSGISEGALLVLAGRALPDDALPAALVVGRALGIAMSFADGRDRSTRRIERLRALLEAASEFARIRESNALLELIAQEATRLLDCDRASIFIWDRERNEVVARPALGMEGNTLRLSDKVGIVGDVIHSGKKARVDNAYSDKRFSKKVDETSGYITRNLLCWPLVGPDGKLIGAFEAINKNSGPFTDDDEETLSQLGRQAALAIQNTREHEQLVRTHEQLTEEVTQDVQIIGDNPAIVALRATVKRLAATDLPVLILGESGTGKEVVSRALHYEGPRASHPFVAVNCAAVPESLLESELFGHEKGAFTDARETRLGKFELADSGTLFLDEIGEMSPGGQAKLLRVIEQKVITRVGGSHPIPINVRIIAATNSNLAESVAAKKFREDLYYRLSVVTQTLPPLRDRPEDILKLAEHFLKRFCIQARRAPLKLSAEARRRLQAHAWPGNIRELRNLMERVAFLCGGERVEAEDLIFILSPERHSALEPSADLGLAEATKLFQQEFIRRSIRRVNGNMSEAARLLDVHRSNLYRKMRQLDMKEAEDAEP